MVGGVKVLILEIILIVLLLIGIAYISTILFFAKKVQHREYYEAEKCMEEWDFWQVEGMNLNFVEQVTSDLRKNGFRWVDDYKLEEKDGSPIKLSKHQNRMVECYIRYFVNEIESTVASIAFYKAYPYQEKDGTEDQDFGMKECMHCFSLETALRNNGHIKSGMIYAPSIGAEKMEELLIGPKDEYKLYMEEGEIDQLIEEHLRWIGRFKETDDIDPIVTLRPLAEVIRTWWKRSYDLRSDIYRYQEEEKRYKLTLSYCIKVVLCYPFFKLHQYI